MRFILVLFFVLHLPVMAAAPTPSLPTQYVKSLTPDEWPSAGRVRLRIRLSSRETVAGAWGRIGGVMACSDSVCFETGAPSTVKLTNTLNGHAERVVDMEVPVVPIRSVHFKLLAGVRAISGGIILPELLKLDPEISGGEIMVVVDAVDKKLANGLYEPVLAASNYLPFRDSPDVFRTIYYDPAFAMASVNWPFGVKLNMPAQASSNALILRIQFSDTAESHPILDIFPVTTFKKAITFELPPIPRSPDFDPEGAFAALTRNSSYGLVRMNILQGGEVRFRPPGPSSITGGAAAGNINVAAAGVMACVNILGSAARRMQVTQELAKFGHLYLSDCTTTAPYVHIAMADMNQTSKRFKLRHNTKILLAKKYRLPLTKIEDWSLNTQILVNGFTWVGDYDIEYIVGYGLAKGYVHDLGGGTLGMNRVEGGTCEDKVPYDYNCPYVGASDGNKRVLVAPYSGAAFSWRDESKTFNLNIRSTYVSSSTSVVKDGVCSGDTLTSRWSAVGTTAAGRLVFLSSTSLGATNAAEMCQVFRVLDVQNAIRLDGGPSTGMTYLGRRLNPIKGIDTLKYGDSRKIPYALQVSN